MWAKLFNLVIRRRYFQAMHGRYQRKLREGDREREREREREKERERRRQECNLVRTLVFLFRHLVALQTVVKEEEFLSPGLSSNNNPLFIIVIFDDIKK